MPRKSILITGIVFTLVGAFFGAHWAASSSQDDERMALRKIEDAFLLIAAICRRNRPYRTLGGGYRGDARRFGSAFGFY